MRKMLSKLCTAILLCLSAPLYAADTLHLYNWNHYLPENTAELFERYCKCELVQTYYGDNEEMLAKLAAGATGYDLVVPTGFAVESLIRQGHAEKLDKKQLPNLKNVAVDFMNNRFDPQNQYSVPYAFTTTLLGYNETQLKTLGILNKAQSWALIFDPTILEKIKGKVTVLDSQRELMAAALIYLGKSANSTNPSDWNEAQAVIRKAKPYWAAFNNQSYIKELTLGHIYVAMGYSSDMYQAQQDAKKAKRRFNINFNLQTEGNTLSLDNLVMLKNAPRKDLAYKFINFMLIGKHAASLTNELGMGNPNQAARAFVQPEMVKNGVVFPTSAALSHLQQLRELSASNRRALNRAWSEIKLR